MLFDLDKLGEPITPPEGVDDPRPVLKATHTSALNAMDSLIAIFSTMRDSLARYPRCDVLFDCFDPAAAVSIAKAAEAVAIFRQTRDCEGES